MLSRTSCKYAIVTLTIRLINSRYKDRGIILDIEGIRELLVDTEIKFEDTKVVLEQLKKEGKLEYEAGRLTRKRKVNAIQTPVYVIRLSQ